LWAPTFSAPASRWSTPIASSMPSARATESASSMIARATARISGSVAICAMVARVSALSGLKQTLPSSLSQISSRIRDRMGALSPPLMRAAAMARHRSLDVPSSSPRERRVPSTCSTTPGPTRVVAG